MPQTKGEILDVLAMAMDQPVLAIDTETNGLDWTKHRVCGYALGWPDHWYYIPVRHTSLAYGPQPAQYPADQVARWVGGVASVPKRWLLWNAKFDLHMLANEGITLRGEVCDGLPASYLVDENGHQGSHSLKNMATKLIDPRCKEHEARVDEWRKTQAAYRKRMKAETITKKDEVSYAELPIDLLAPYACADVHYTWVLWHRLEERYGLVA